MMHHCSLYWSSVKSFLAICFLIIGDHFRLHFYNIPQCQLTISWVAMVTCGPIVFPKVLWMQHLRIIFDFNALDMMQIFKSIPMVVNWYKTEIAPYFYKWCFFYIYYQTENMNRKGIMWVKASEGTAMPCGFTRHPQHGMGKSPSKCYNVAHKTIRYLLKLMLLGVITVCTFNYCYQEIIKSQQHLLFFCQIICIP